MRRERSSRTMEMCRGYAAAAMEGQERTRILIGEGDAKARWALREFLRAQPGLDVVAEAADGGSLLEGTEAACPDLVLLEWDLPGGPKADLIAALRNLEPQPLVVVLGTYPESSSPAMGAGADASSISCASQGNSSSTCGRMEATISVNRVRNYPPAGQAYAAPS